MLVAVGIPRIWMLHVGGDLGDRPSLPVGDVHEGLEERGGGVVDVANLGRGSPPLGGPLLEEAERVTIAMVEVAQTGLLISGGEHDHRCVRGLGGGRECPDGRDRTAKCPALWSRRAEKPRQHSTIC